MQQVASMQLAKPSQQLVGQPQPLRQRQRAMAAQALGESLSGVLAHQVIKMLALRQSVQLGEMPALDAAQEPFLEQQGLGCQRIVGTCGGKGLQQPGLALFILDPVEQGLAGFAEQLPDPPAFEELAGLQRRRQWPLAQLREGVAEAACGHGFHAYQQGAGVVLAACQVGGANQGLGAALRLLGVAQDAADTAVAQRRPDAVADQ